MPTLFDGDTGASLGTIFIDEGVRQKSWNDVLPKFLQEAAQDSALGVKSDIAQENFPDFQDSQIFSEVTQRSDPALVTGDGSTNPLTGTIAADQRGVKILPGSFTATDGVEIFTDPNADGVLVGDQGGSGTLNFDTGAFSLTFNTAVVNLVDVAMNLKALRDVPLSDPIRTSDGREYSIRNA
ncbi:hypothetical protein LCGC14_1252920 [marine sediment metagenome]|uniref:Uncharacterized protein n=1 Tax=marine sediment metagenome TaxID=412755 RepID=A0A0F9L5Z1_9ZZZZ